MSENGLKDNKWLNHLHEIRVSWMPIYNGGISFAGMNTTRRSDNISSFFDALLLQQQILKSLLTNMSKH